MEIMSFTGINFILHFMLFLETIIKNILNRQLTKLIHFFFHPQAIRICKCKWDIPVALIRKNTMNLNVDEILNFTSLHHVNKIKFNHKRINKGILTSHFISVMLKVKWWDTTEIEVNPLVTLTKQNFISSQKVIALPSEHVIFLLVSHLWWYVWFAG